MEPKRYVLKHMIGTGDDPVRPFYCADIGYLSSEASHSSVSGDNVFKLFEQCLDNPEKRPNRGALHNKSFVHKK